MIYNSNSFILAVLFLLLIHCSKKDDNIDDIPAQTSRIIEFAGYKWEVRSSKEKAGPGPNYFSNSQENVWVDNFGKLHLRISQRNGKWYCAGVTLLSPTKYGEYFFETETDINLWDDNMVGGLFLYKNDNEEIDIEYTKWGKKNNLNAQFVVQPGSKPSNKKRFNLDLQTIQQTSIISWGHDSIFFSNYKGPINNINESNLTNKWNYVGSDNPSEKNDLAVKINFWLFRGAIPQEETDKEFIISNFMIR